MEKQPPSPSAPATPKGPARNYWPLVMIAIGLGIFFAFDLHRYFSLEALKTHRQALLAIVDAHPRLALGAFIAIYAVAVGISFPGASILTIFGGFLFGTWPGGPATVVGATLGATAVYLAAAHAAGTPTRTDQQNGLMGKIQKGFEKNELSYLLMVRLVPLFPFWAVNLGAGLARVKLRNFLLATFFGIIPGTFIYVGIGETAGELFDAGQELSLGGVLWQPKTLFLLGALTLFSLAPIFYKAKAERAAS